MRGGHSLKDPLLRAIFRDAEMTVDQFWLHGVSNERWTFFFAHANRGGEAIKAMAVLQHFRGILCHDHWKPYFQLTCLHVLCNAPHLRELERAWEQDGQRWAQKMQDLLLEINDATTKAGGCLTGQEAEPFLRRY